MDNNRFDRLTRLFAATGSRRRAVSALISAAILGHDADILARKRNGKGGQGKNGPGHGKSGKGKGRGRGQREGHNKNDRAADAPASDPALADPAAADAASGAAPQNTSGDGKDGRRRKHGKGRGNNNMKKNKDKDRNTQPTGDPAGSEPGSGSSEATPEDASALAIEATAQAESCWRAGACIVKKGANVSQCNLAGYTAPDPLDCTGCNLSRANLRGADLTGVNFTRANLSYACLIDADFTGAAFANNTNLFYATFCRTTMPDGSINNSGCASGTACCSTGNAGFKQCGNLCIANDQCRTNGSAGCAQGRTCCSGRCQECCGSMTNTCPAVPPGATCQAPSCQGGACGLVNGPNGEPGNNCASPRFCQDGVCIGCVTPATCPPAPICKVAACNGGECDTANQENGATCSLSGGGQGEGEGVCANGECVQCITPGACPAPPICQVATCTGNQCGAANANNGPAPGCPDPGCCNGACCTSGQVCAGSRCCPRQTPDDCGGTCTDTNTDLNNCGGCGRVCSFPHASATCVAGACELGACDQGFANCDGNPSTGCETPLGADQHCSGCGDVCSGGTVCQKVAASAPSVRPGRMRRRLGARRVPPVRRAPRSHSLARRPVTPVPKPSPRRGVSSAQHPAPAPTPPRGPAPAGMDSLASAARASTSAACARMDWPPASASASGNGARRNTTRHC